MPLSRFLKYVAFDTASEPGQANVPSTQKQFALAKYLVEEMQAIGISDARMSEHGYVFGSIPATKEGVKALGFVAHMDTAPDCSGKDVKPRIVKEYDGGRIQLNETYHLDPEEDPALKNYVGKDLIVTDGNTLLGADDKAGIAEIMAMAERILHNPFPHGKICIGFTPDEEVGRGASKFDVEDFGAEIAYTVDGGALGELEYENFNGASAKAVFHGRGIHPGSAKDAMVNAMNLAMEFHAMLPAHMRPEHTEGYDGFIHLIRMKGDVEEASLDYIIRDHDREKFEAKKALVEAAGEYLKARHGEHCIDLTVKDSYYNMREKILPHMELIDHAKEAMLHNGVTPVVKPIRGGTDGSVLSFKGLPCPNLCTGGHNFHGRFEYIPVQSMEKMADILVELVRIMAE